MKKLLLIAATCFILPKMAGSIQPSSFWECDLNTFHLEGFHPASLPLLNMVPLETIQKQKVPKSNKGQSFPREFVNKVKFFEGFKAKAYYCCGGVKTIGYGATDKNIVKRGVISESQAAIFLIKELEDCRNKVRETVKVPISNNQELALISFTMNLGPSALAKLVNGKGRLNSGNYNNVPKLIKLYNQAGGKVRDGLVKRRGWEAQLFNQ